MTPVPYPLDKLPPEHRQRLTPEPQPAQIEPMLATPTTSPPSKQGWLYERKLDGQRALGYHAHDRTRLTSRGHHTLDTTYPDLHEALDAQAQNPCILDGEIIAFQNGEPSFEALQHRMHNPHPTPTQRAEHPVAWLLFDVLHVQGYSTRNLPQHARKQILPHVIQARPPLKILEPTTGPGVRLIEEACKEGWEGLIAKRTEASYEQRRSRAWLKLKCARKQEFVVGGYTPPSGSREGFGALLIGYHEGGDLVYAGKVGTGFSDKMLRGLTPILERLEQPGPPFRAGDPPRTARWVEPRIVVKAAYTERTTGGRLRHPRFLGLRLNKEPAEVVWEPIVVAGG